MCQRMAVIAASEDVQEARLFFRNLGYRWYHVLPDGSFSIKNNPYLSITFYKQLLGVK